MFKKFQNKNFIVGFDGFIDEIYTVANNQKMSDFRDSFSDGISKNFELIKKTTKMGGNGPILSNALLSLGAKVTSVGLFGGIFKTPFEDLMKGDSLVCSLGSPCKTTALEFSDGKLMFSDLENIKQVTWNNINRYLTAETYKNADIIACTNWTMIPDFENIVKRIPKSERQIFFFDLADPKRRSKKDLFQILELIRNLNGTNKCILGLNLSEARQVSELFGTYYGVSEELLCENIHNNLDCIYSVVVHSKRKSCAVIDGTFYHQNSFFCENPVILTGAGDHFNAGFLAGIANETPENSLLWAVGLSGFYVSLGRTPNREELKSFLRERHERTGHSA